MGSLAGEVSHQDPVAREMLQSLFGAWEELFRELLHRFQNDGLSSPEADTARLATGFVAAVQGGYLLAQASKDVAPMATAIDMSIAHLRLLGHERRKAS